MKIGIISVNDKSTNLLARGGTEVFSANLAYQLTKLGHKVFLFGSGDSIVDGVEVIGSTDENLYDIQQNFESKKWDEIKNIFHVKNILMAKKYEDYVDIFHDNMSCSLSLSMLEIFSKPVVSTLHMPIDGLYRTPLLSKYIYNNNISYVVASKFQKQFLPHNMKSSYIPNGINTCAFQKFGIKNDTEDMLWIGRINSCSPKGLDDAISAGIRMNKKLRYVGLIEDADYFKQNIEPILNNNVIEQRHFLSDEEKVLFYRSGKVLLNPIKWEEPFGLTYIEAMATGTPVISYALGAASEIVDDGETGLLVHYSKTQRRGNWIIKKDGIEGLCEAIQYIYSLTEEEYLEMRKKCAKRAKEKFDVVKMAKNYEHLYNTILEQ